MYIDKLEEIGLSNTEAKIYLALLELGSVTVNKIAERSGIHRRTVYDILETLIEKGLVSFVIEANKKYYQAETPARFLDILKDREKELETILPDLLAKRELSKKPQEVTVYRGKRGLKNVHTLMLRTKRVIYTFGSGGKFKEILGDIFYEKWMRKFIENKCQMKIISSKTLKKEKFPKTIKIKYIPEEFVIPSSTSIWEDRVFIQIFSDQPIGILIRSKEVVDSYLKYFNVLWRLAKE